MAIENNMIPCPYNCKQGAHPKGTRFCPFNGKPIPKPPPVALKVEEEPPIEIAKVPGKTIVEKPAKKNRTISITGNKKKILFIIIPVVVICVIAVIVLFNNGTSPSPDNDITDIVEPKKTGETKKITNRTGNDNAGQTKAKKIVKGPVTPAGSVITKTYAYAQLPAQIKKDYQRQLNELEWKTVTLHKKVNTTIDGRMDLRLDIDERGKITVIDYFDNNLNVTPQSKKQEIISTLKGIIKAEIHRCAPINAPQDETGAKIKVTDFQCTVNIKEIIKALPFRNLPTAIKAKIESQTRDIIQFPVNGNIDVNGEIKFLLTIDEKGSIRVQDNSDFSRLAIVPPDKRNTVIEAAAGIIANRVFEPVQESNGTLLKVKDVTLTVVPRPVKTKEFMELSAPVIQAYKTQMNSFGDIPLHNSIQVNGQIRFRLRIDEHGKITIESANNSQLRVIPENEIDNITGRVKMKIQSRTLKSQTDENGAFLRTANFPLTLNITMRQRNLILRRLKER